MAVATYKTFLVAEFTYDLIFDTSPMSDRFGTRYVGWIPTSANLYDCSFSHVVLFCEPGEAYLAGARGLQCSRMCRDQYLLCYSLETLREDGVLFRAPKAVDC